MNVKAVSNICACAKEIGAKIVYFSSDYVFDGVFGQDTFTCEGRKSIYEQESPTAHGAPSPPVSGGEGGTPVLSGGTPLGEDQEPEGTLRKGPGTRG